MRFFIVPTLGTRVKNARDALGLRQEQLAELTGVSQQAINKIESGTTKKPSCINALSKALGVSVDYLESGSASASRDNPTLEAESYMLTAKAALLESIASMRAINKGRSKPDNELDQPLLMQAFEISLRAKLTGDYLTAALELRDIKIVTPKI